MKRESIRLQRDRGDLHLRAATRSPLASTAKNGVIHAEVCAACHPFTTPASRRFRRHRRPRGQFRRRYAKQPAGKKK